MNDDKKALQQKLKSLQSKREDLSLESKAIHSELTSSPGDGVEPIGIDTPLVDKEGYPRNDVDIYRARDLRRRWHEIQNDLQSIMNELETKLVQLAAFDRNVEDDEAEMKARLAKKPKPKYDAVSGKWCVRNWDGTVAGLEGGHQYNFDNLEETDRAIPNEASKALLTQQTGLKDGPTMISSDPFCVIDSVEPCSPAEEAGLKEHDMITNFGSIDHSNHKNLSALAEMVLGAASAGSSLAVKVERQVLASPSIREETGVASNVEHLEIQVFPKRWSGRGLLGCHMQPI